MKLFAWQSKEQGPLSFFVCAENEQKAKEAVSDYIVDHLYKKDEPSLTAYNVDSWFVGEYQLVEVEAMTVLTHAND